MRVLVLHGPNLNLVGERDPQLYGKQTLEEINGAILRAATELRLDARCEQHNAEGRLIDALHAARKTDAGGRTTSRRNRSRSDPESSGSCPGAATYPAACQRVLAGRFVWQC